MLPILNSPPVFAIASVQGFFAHPFFVCLLHRDAYVAVIRLVESVDDTITCQKMLLAELLQPLEVCYLSVGHTPESASKTFSVLGRSFFSTCIALPPLPPLQAQIT